jgi:hypothetical protein
MKYRMAAVIVMAPVDAPDFPVVAAAGVSQPEMWVRGRLEKTGLSQGHRKQTFLPPPPPLPLPLPVSLPPNDDPPPPSTYTDLVKVSEGDESDYLPVLEFE